MGVGKLDVDETVIIGEALFAMLWASLSDSSDTRRGSPGSVGAKFVVLGI